ncbi:uncharacterized protein RJT21DRAFT_119555 [Scheffersomyces amazonensis]|uniref:uncharacterized protein n=1 Tax=Scheffersomyces amazonensis TaxID=1078765 RepID=UPI00315CDD4B
MSLVSSSIYGGAIQIKLSEEIAYSALDASKFRQVPDSQEVFIIPTPSKSSKYDRSLIIALLQIVPEESYNKAIATHIEDLIEEDHEKITNHYIEQIKDELDNDIYLSVIEYDNKRRDAKEEGSPLKYVTFISLIRLPKVETDVLITLDIPIETEVDLEDLLSSIKINHHSNNEIVTGLKYNYEWFRQISVNFKVKDWSLFGHN